LLNRLSLLFLYNSVWGELLPMAKCGPAATQAQQEDSPPVDPWDVIFQTTFHQSHQTRLDAEAATASANIAAGIVNSFLLPIFFSTIGAIAYVIRAISEQIKASTFSNSSPIRHLMRVTLGVLMGVVVGLFSGLSAQVSLSPLAIAFLAGYGVEAVFSMFDNLVERFKTT
jgi:hypothetical protein